MLTAVYIVLTFRHISGGRGRGATANRMQSGSVGQRRERTGARLTPRADLIMVFSELQKSVCFLASVFVPNFKKIGRRWSGGSCFTALRHGKCSEIIAKNAVFSFLENGVKL